MQKIRLTIQSKRTTQAVCNILIDLGISFQYNPLPNIDHWIEFDDENGRTDTILRNLTGYRYFVEKLK